MRTSDIIEYLGEHWTAVRTLMASGLSSDIELLNHINASVLGHSGKMLRPMLCLLSAAVCGADATGWSNAERFAAASELLHNATLFHDDVVDGSDERRGLPTVMSLVGGNASVLIGDFWLVKAMESILSASEYSEEVIRIFAKTLADLAQGEMLQMEKAGRGDTTEEDYYRIIYFKTASLFETAAVSGARAAHASGARLEAIREYAVKLGYAFQIRDDMFDYSDGGDIGKPVGIDLKEQKITLPLLLSLATVSDGLAGDIRSKVCNIGEHPEYEPVVRDFVAECDGVGLSRKRLMQHIGEAKSALDIFQPSAARDFLVAMADFVGERSV
ncbi:MAG: polyprenyl synthetase family protein [Bacteroidales bacterium]|nr:polyprenyl synthetase family protein [Bacteroidales bacterium]